MTNEEAIHKLEYSKKAYQKLIDEKVDSGKLVGDGVRGEWKAETPLDKAYKDMIEACEIAIKALEQKPHNAEFVPSRDGYDGHVTCNNCFKIYDWDSEAQYFNYCPNCGARMESEENECK